MAFPWQLALSAMETSDNNAPVRTQGRLDETTHHLQLSGHSSDWVPMDCLTLSIVIGEAEEEGDHTSPFAFALATSPVHGFTIPTEATSLPPLISVERFSFPLAQRLHLRC